MLYVKQSSGVSNIDKDFSLQISSLQSQITTLKKDFDSNMNKSAAYWNGHGNYYNIASSSSSTDYKGTAWSQMIFDHIGLTYVPDNSTYKHGFRLPFKGLYLIFVVLKFSGLNHVWKSSGILRCQLLRNGIKQAIVGQIVDNHSSGQYVFLNNVTQADSLIQITVQQQSGNTVSVDCGDSYIYITYLGTK